MIKILVQRLTTEGFDFSGEEPPSLLDVNDEGILSISPVRYALKAALVNNGVIVTGRAETKLECRCGRCAASFPLAVSNSEVCHFYEGHDQAEIDLTDDIREDILITFPFYFVCSERCRGLCFKCGKNLNNGDCGCAVEESAVTPWSELDNLKL